MKRRWFFWIAVAVASFGLIMQAAHIGSTNLWIVVSGIAFASGAIIAGTLSAARRLRPWASRLRANGGKGDAVMKRLLHRVGPAVPIFGPPRSQRISYLGTNGGAVKKRLLRRVGPAVAIFGLIMAVAYIGPTTLWIAVVKIALALGIFAERWRSPAGRRWRH